MKIYNEQLIHDGKKEINLKLETRGGIIKLIAVDEAGNRVAKVCSIIDGYLNPNNRCEHVLRDTGFDTSELKWDCDGRIKTS